jgi:hypothetical protein
MLIVSESDLLIKKTPNKLSEELVLCAFASVHPDWINSATFIKIMRDRLQGKFSDEHVRVALGRACGSFLVERRAALDPALEQCGRRGRKTVFEYALTRFGAEAFNVRERDRALILGYDPIVLDLSPAYKSRRKGVASHSVIDIIE